MVKTLPSISAARKQLSSVSNMDIDGCTVYPHMPTTHWDNISCGICEQR